MNVDPAFSSAIEKAYLNELARLNVRPDMTHLTVHADLLERAIYRADPTNGGLRFKRLPNRDELESRLLRALSRRMRR